MMRLAFITVGDPQRRTGGYLYHSCVFAGLRARGFVIDEISASGAALAQQQAAAAAFGEQFSPERYAVIVIDALARVVCGPWIEGWRSIRPVVALVHQLPSVAEVDPSQLELELRLEAPLLQADRLIAVSEHGRAILIQRGVPADRIAIVWPGFDRLPLDSMAPRPRSAGAPVRALCVGQWIPRKGITSLIAAWQQLAPANAALELIGETDADPEYAQQVGALLATTPAETVIVHGLVTDVALQQAYRSADLFVLPSRFEGYGMVYAEALAHGLPIVACDVGPVPALITDQAGLFVPPDDPPALAQALAQLLDNPELRARLAGGARARAATLPTWNDAARGFAQAIDAAIAQTTGA